MESDQSIRFYSAWFCPFAQRAWMALLLKQIEFEYIEVDPYKKSAWWSDISRQTEQVPVVVYQGDEQATEFTIIDSTRVVEFQDELQPGIHPLLPGNPAARAEHRYWVDHVNNRVVPYFYRYLKANKPGKFRNESKGSLLNGLETMFQSASQNHPYLFGAHVGMVDLLLVPFAYRIECLLGHYRDFSLPEGDGIWSRYQAWYQTMISEPVFKATATDHDNYRDRLIEFYRPYSEGKGQTDVTRVS